MAAVMHPATEVAMAKQRTALALAERLDCEWAARDRAARRLAAISGDLARAEVGDPAALLSAVRTASMALDELAGDLSPVPNRTREDNRG